MTLLLFSYTVLILVGAMKITVATLGVSLLQADVLLVITVVGLTVAGGTYAHASTTYAKGILLLGVAGLFGWRATTNLLADHGAALDSLRAADPALLDPHPAGVGPLLERVRGLPLSARDRLRARLPAPHPRQGPLREGPAQLPKVGWATGGLFLLLGAPALLVGLAARAQFGTGVLQDDMVAKWSRDVVLRAARRARRSDPRRRRDRDAQRSVPRPRDDDRERRRRPRRAPDPRDEDERPPDHAPRRADRDRRRRRAHGRDLRDPDRSDLAARSPRRLRLRRRRVPRRDRRVPRAPAVGALDRVRGLGRSAHLPRLLLEERQPRPQPVRSRSDRVAVVEEPEPDGRRRCRSRPRDRPRRPLPDARDRLDRDRRRDDQDRRDRRQGRQHGAGRGSRAAGQAGSRPQGRQGLRARCGTQG